AGSVAGDAGGVGTANIFQTSVLVMAGLVPAIHVFGLARLGLPPFNIEIHVNRHVIGRLVPAADVTVYAGIDQTVGGLRREQQMIDADTVILCPCSGLIIP